MLGEVEPAFLKFERNYMEYLLLRELQPHVGQMDGSRASLIEINNRIQSKTAQKELLERRMVLTQIDYERNKDFIWTLTVGIGQCTAGWKPTNT